MPKASSLISDLNLDQITSRYTIEQEKPIGFGSFGFVYKCRDKLTGELVAIKIYEDFPDNTLDRKSLYREIRVLKMLKGMHNTVELKNIITSKLGDTYLGIALVLKYYDTSLYNEIYYNSPVPREDIPRIMHQVLAAVSYMHSANIVHRDLKPANILISRSSKEVKVCDFGLSRSLNRLIPEPDTNEPTFLPLTSKLTHYVVTRCYRAPEIVIESDQYGFASDMWSVGCILAELLIGRPLFNCAFPRYQLQAILAVIGTPEEKDCDWIENRRLYEDLRPSDEFKSRINDKFQGHHPYAVDLLKKLLTFNPNKRINAEKALIHPFVIGQDDKCCRFDVSKISEHERVLLDNYYVFEQQTERCNQSSSINQLIVERIDDEVLEYPRSNVVENATTSSSRDMKLVASSNIPGTVFHYPGVDNVQGKIASSDVPVVDSSLSNVSSNT